MRTVMVRYRTTAAYADANEAAIRAVFAELRRRGTPGVRYASHRLPEGVFVHVATLAAPPASGAHPITSLPVFETFQARLRENLVEPPVTTELVPFEAYGDSLGAATAEAI